MFGTAIGLSGWGIAFYIDGKLAPLLQLRRNVTYTFIVEAGDDPNDVPNYHPFYITNSQDGGILLNQGMRVSKCLPNLSSRNFVMIITTNINFILIISRTYQWFLVAITFVNDFVCFVSHVIICVE